ncbi:GTP-binding protein BRASSINAZOLE INSENSITIVE PALE GREEN 2, chloroplastic isoform X2 [Arachis stenosperma]|uniref:GTP-binding protein BRASSINAZOLE INSENSITIVE PALE GREEN 2, chloroplastic isoform X2 n=1 Tax=Arachis stenosperma TaxID=217475 RepID=UPI0025AB8841|nr:GTP-binding protein BRASSINAZOLE INSENSITIVE PALE GREEN 2, chloroplastic isoform X2 [Arachis stenosperma]
MVPFDCWIQIKIDPYTLQKLISFLILLQRELEPVFLSASLHALEAMAIFFSTIVSLNFPACKFSFLNNVPDQPLKSLRHFTDNSVHTRKVPCFIAFAVNGSSAVQTEKRNTPRKKGRNPFLSEGRDEDESRGPICPGCGVFMQDEDPNLPGYYQQRKVKMEDELLDEDDDVFDDINRVKEEENDDDDVGSLDGIENELGGGIEVLPDDFDWDSDEWEAKLLGEEDDEADLNGFAPAGVGYGNITEEVLERKRKKKVSKAEKKKLAREAQKVKEEVTVCARCHSLRNYGQVKNQTAENLIPDFDFDRLISTRLMNPSGNGSATVVVMVVDCVDFDGSFPRTAAKSLFKALERNQDDSKKGKKLPKLVLVATKVDLLPSEVSPARLDRWVRHRASAAGAPKLSAVYLVSSRKDLGVRNLLSFIKDLAGPRGNVWVIGSQNAGKSTLINAFSKKHGAKATKLTEAPIPGTTLGILRIGGILSAKTKMFDTPGLLHPYLMSMRLNREEQKMVEIRKELRPRSYRIKARQAVHIGGLTRIDLIEASVETIYVTVWASPNVSLHMGKVENAEEVWSNHVGVRLQPPIGSEHAAELGTWQEMEIKVSGTSWEVNNVDVAIAGLGWYSLCLKGEATMKLWTFDGVEVTLREPLVLDRARSLEKPGFWLPRAISDAIGNQTKLEAQKREKLDDQDTDFVGAGAELSA